MSEFKDDFLRNLKARHSDLEWTDPDKVSEAIDILNDALDKVSFMLCPNDEFKMAEIIAEMMMYNIPLKICDEIADTIKEEFK